MNKDEKRRILEKYIIEYLNYIKIEKKQKVTIDLINNLLKEEVLSLREKKQIKDHVVAEYSGEIQAPSGKKDNQFFSTQKNIKQLNFENIYSKFFQKIYNNWGFGAMSYFKFIKFIMKLNFMVLVISFVFLGSVPLFGTGHSYNIARKTCLNATCPDYVPKPTTNVLSAILSIFSGEGFVEASFIFYTKYGHPVYKIPIINSSYNMRMGYPLVILCCYALSLIYLGMMLSNQSKTAAIYKNIRNPDINFTQLVYIPVKSENWQSSRKHYKRRLQMELFYKQNEELYKAKTTVSVIIARVIINIITMVLIAGSGVIIYYANNLALKNKGNYLIEYIPTFIFIIFDFIFPIILEIFQYVEKYKGNHVIIVQLLRLVSFRLVPLTTYSYLVFTTTITKDPCCQCWESQVGKSLYKILFSIMIFDLLSILIITPVRIVVTKKYPEFFLMDNIIQLIKMQLLQWILMLLLPLISMITFFFQIFLLLLKYIELKYLTSQSKIPLNYIPSEMFFTGVLLVVFNFKCFISFFVFFNVPTSVSCGPFRTFTLYGSLIEHKIKGIPELAYKILFTKSTGIAIALIFITTIIILYCRLSILKFDQESLKKNINLKKKMEKETNEIRIKYFNKSKKYKNVINDLDNICEDEENE